MNQIVLMNLYEALISHINFGNIVESYGEDDVTLENANLDLLKVLYAGFFITLVIDQYAEKVDEDTVRFKFVPGFIDKVVELFADNNGKGYSLGNLRYKDASTVLVKLRNKLAHGDFIIRDGDIIFTEKKVEGKINIDRLLTFISSFEQSYEDYTLYDNRIKTFHYVDRKTKLTHIDKEGDMDKLCRSLYKIELINNPMFPNVRDANHWYIMHNVYRKVISLISSSTSLEKISFELEKIKEELKKKRIMLDFKITNYPELEYYEQIKNKYRDQLRIYAILPAESQISIMNHFSYILSKGQYQKFNIRKGIFLNEVMLKGFSENPTGTLREIIDSQPNIMHLYLYDIDEAILASYLANFNSMYGYGLEKVLSSDGNSSIMDIYHKTKLDFSKLDLTLLDSDTMAIEKTFDSQLEKYKSDVINQCNRRINTCIYNKDQYITKTKHFQEEELSKKDEKIEQAKMGKIAQIEHLIELEEFDKNFDKEKYTRNLNIIYHIRNAIAHGNIYVDSYSNDIRNKDIIIRDYKGSTLIYEKRIKMNVFTSLFQECNLRVLIEFYQNNIEDPYFVNPLFADEVVERIKIRRKKMFDFIVK